MGAYNLIYICIYIPVYRIICRTWCEFIESDSAYSFQFSYIKLCFADFQNKRQFQIQLHCNLWFHGNMILFLLFSNYYDFCNHDTNYTDRYLLFICYIFVLGIEKLAWTASFSFPSLPFPNYALPFLPTLSPITFLSLLPFPHTFFSWFNHKSQLAE